MPLTAYALCAYLTVPPYAVEWRPEDTLAAKFVKALKGEHFRRTQSLYFEGREYRFRRDLPDGAFECCTAPAGT